MPTHIEKLLSDLEQIAEYYKLHGKEANYLDLRNALDKFYNSRKLPKIRRCYSNADCEFKRLDNGKYVCAYQFGEDCIYYVLED